jgi:actin-related protein
MGYAGNSEPSFIFPTVIATNETAGSLTGGSKTTGVEDLNFSIGDEAIANSQTMQAYYPVRHGLVDNWTHMEKYVLSLLVVAFLSAAKVILPSKSLVPRCVYTHVCLYYQVLADVHL